MSLMPSQGRLLGMIDCASWSLQMLAAGLARRINEESHAHDVMCKIATHLCMLPEGPVGTSNSGQHMCQISGSMRINVAFTSLTLSSEASERIYALSDILYIARTTHLSLTAALSLSNVQNVQVSTSCNSQTQDSAYKIP